MFPYVRKKGTLAVKPKGKYCGEHKIEESNCLSKTQFSAKDESQSIGNESCPVYCI